MGTRPAARPVHDFEDLSGPTTFVVEDRPGTVHTVGAIIDRIGKIGELIRLEMAETSSLAQLWLALQIHQTMALQHDVLVLEGTP